MLTYIDHFSGILQLLKNFKQIKNIQILIPILFNLIFDKFMILFKLDSCMLELMKRVFSVTFMIAILVTMAVVTTVAHMPDAEAFQKAKGVYQSKHGLATKGIVCGDRLCSEIGQVTSSDVPAMKTKSPQHTPMSIGAIPIDSVTGATIKDTMIDKQSEAVIISIDLVFIEFIDSLVLI